MSQLTASIAGCLKIGTFGSPVGETVQVEMTFAFNTQMYNCTVPQSSIYCHLARFSHQMFRNGTVVIIMCVARPQRQRVCGRSQ